MNVPFQLLISEHEIKTKLIQVCKQLDVDYRNETVVLVMVMKGSLCLVSDLIRNVHFPVILEYVSASSYGGKGTERGELTLKGIDAMNVENQHVLLVDDIFHSGETISQIRASLVKRHPKSIKTLVLLLKNLPRDITQLPDYHLFEVGDQFVVGYGMDYKELYRGFPGVYVFN